MRQKRNYRKTSYRFYICTIVVLLLMIICAVGTLYLYKNRQKHTVTRTVDLEQLDSPYAVLLDAGNGEKLASKRSDEIIFPASMVKIMTVYTAIREINDLDRHVVMDAGFYEMLYQRDASRAGFEPGEEVVVHDLLYGAMLPSGAECCLELAVLAAGSEDAFVEKMNSRAAEWGLAQTHFTNCTGLHDDNQISTVYEIGQILQNAIKNQEFSRVFTTRAYTMAPSSIHPDGFTVTSSMFKHLEENSIKNGELLGGKTGYTDEAGHCLASLAEIEGEQYILVTAGWAANPKSEQYHITDAVTAYNQLSD